jgi:exonuclease SbcC
LLDAISFALYGRTPRAGKSTRDLINQRMDSAHVELLFAVEGEVWRAVRALRRRGQGAHNLYRLASAAADAETVEHVAQERAMTARVGELLGLEFDAFNRSVFLAQNRFAEFLHATPSQRDGVLKGVFAFDRLDRMAEIAKERRDEARSHLAELERLGAQVGLDKEALAEARPALAAARSHQERLEEAVPRVAASEQEIATAGAALVAAERALGDLRQQEAELPQLEGARRLLESAAEIEVGADQAHAAVLAAASAVEEAEASLAAFNEETGGPAGLARGRALLERLDELSQRAIHSEDAIVAAARALTDAEKTQAQLQRAAGKASAAADAAREAATDADQVAMRAESALVDARHDAMAAALRRELHAGDDCPVCAQVVEEVPPALVAPKIAAAEKDLAGARAELDRARTHATNALAAAETAKAEAIGAVRDTERVAAGLAEAKRIAQREAEAVAIAQEELGSLLGLDDPAARLAAAQRRWDELDESVTAARLAHRRALEAGDEARARRTRLQADLSSLAAAIATQAGRLGVDLARAADSGGLADSIEQLHKLWLERLQAAEEEVRRSTAAAEAAQGDLAQILNALELDVPYATARVEAAAEVARLEERVSVLEQRVVRLQELQQESQDTVDRLAVYDRLAEDLLPSRFLKYILDEERRSLAALGSEHLEHMTGRYRFTRDGEFDVVDLNAAEAVRKVESLSGGETFLASLSLALALAEMVTRTGGRLDAFFLDEGFGSLDPEHLALAMDGIEKLVAGDRLVAVVSHVPELRERVEDLIVLDKDSVTGDSVVVRG